VASQNSLFAVFSQVFSRAMVRSFALAAALTAQASAKVFFEDNFDAGISDKWVTSNWKGESMGEWKWTAGEWFGDEDKAKGMMVTEDMRFHAISAKMDSAASTVAAPLIVQFTVKHEKKDYAFCGGGYIKLLTGAVDSATFGGDTPYAIMFGPDLCGYDVSRVHLIFGHDGENLLKDEELKLDYNDKDEFTHLYTLVLNADSTYEVFLDQKSKGSGSIEEGWGFPKKEIKDPALSKPADWVDTKKIPDPAAIKPEGWDDISPEIPDPDAETPEDWDVEEDGEWEPPMTDNPLYKGAWSAEIIDNPDYKGEWVHPTVSNEKYAPATYAKYSDITAVGFELWTVNAGSIFDNILVTDDKAYADKVAAETWALITVGEKEAKDAHKKATEPESDADGGDDEDDEDAEDEVHEVDEADMKDEL